jgi:hypothetical protein
MITVHLYGWYDNTFTACQSTELILERVSNLFVEDVDYTLSLPSIWPDYG